MTTYGPEIDEPYGFSFSTCNEQHKFMPTHQNASQLQALNMTMVAIAVLRAIIMLMTL